MKTYTLIIAIIFTVSILNAQEVKINNNLAVEADGTIRMDGTATVFDDVMIFPDATSKSGSNPPVFGRFARDAAGTSQGVFLWMFSSSTEQEVYFTIQIPHSYKLGSDIYPHVHWTTVTGTPFGTDVVWSLEYTVSAIGGIYSTTNTLTTNTVISACTPIVGPSQHLISSFSPISGTGLGISTVLVCRLYRATGNNSDTFGNAVGLLGIDFHIEKDTEGSRTEFSK